ncbi:MAG: energy transducer TonB [Burkholderiales bacterium]|nr:energy transducer TonB [Burkholderiales bacterium]
MMRELFQQTGARRFGVAAGLSVALHAAIAVSVQRHPGGEPPLQAEPATAPLMARLATAVSDAVLPAAEPAFTPAAETAPAAHPAPANTLTPLAGNSNPAGDGSVHYFKTSELDRRPFPLTRIEVPPPESAEALAGSVMIRLRISERGRVEDAKIVMGTGIAEFEAAALREFSQAQFHPGYRSNLPVRSEMLIEVTLRPPVSDGRNRAAPVLPPQS